jgi:hypothetical protein
MKTVADQFAETLAAAGVKRIYGIVGDSLNGLTDALRRQGKIEWVHVRHEEVAAFAAGAEAHLTGELAVCAGSCGPGNLHLINGLFDCHRSRVPVLAIAAQIPSAEIGAGYFQETHPETLIGIFADQCLTELAAEELGQFERLLEEDDPLIDDWVSGRQLVPREHDNKVMTLLRRFHLAISVCHEHGPKSPSPSPRRTGSFF